MKTQNQTISKIESGSYAHRLGILPGDTLLEINGQPIEDVFDYQYLIQDCELSLKILKADGSEVTLSVEKDYEEDLGLVFENGLMDDYRSCFNKCIFCFIDQMPPGMRETLYFKDDDSRLSFLQGNYITLTNMSDHDVERIVTYHLAPINISFQTTNPELRCMMLHNRFAGEALAKVDQFYEAGIEMNGQIVLCKGVNDGEELARSIRDLRKYLPHLRSVSVVPVGLSKYREGLYPLEPFTKEDALSVIGMIEQAQIEVYEEYGIHFIHASDEWYLLAGLPIPEEERYDGYLQLENGVGMMRLLENEFVDALYEVEHLGFFSRLKLRKLKNRSVSVATGRLAYPQIKSMADRVMARFPQIHIDVYEIRNDFFGERITVSGLITGQDLVKQLKDQSLGEVLCLPQNMLRAGESYFLDDVTLAELEQALQVRTCIVKSSGYDFVESMLGFSIFRKKEPDGET